MRAHEEPGGYEGGRGLAGEVEEHGGGAAVWEGRRGADGTEFGGGEGARRVHLANFCTNLVPFESHVGLKWDSKCHND